MFSDGSAEKRAQRSRITNMNKVVQVGFKLLLENWDVTTTALFASSPKGTVCKVYLETLNSEDTTEVNPCEINNEYRRGLHFELCKEAERSDDNPGLALYLQKICLVRGQLHPEHVGSHMQSPQTKLGGGP